jgi:hypothetical protein
MLEPYRRNWSFEDQMIEGLAGLMLWATIIVSAIVMTILIVLLKELGRVYAARAFQPTRTARVLWIALAGLVGLWLLGAVLATNPANAVLGAYIASWAFLAFVLVVEGCDQYEKRFDPPPQAEEDEESIQDVLGEWNFEDVPTVNGQPELVGSGRR